MRNGDFTKRKFLGFPLKQQHKKCAELLRTLYEKKIRDQQINNEVVVYDQLVEWMKLPKSSLCTHQKVADSYHHHLNLASVSHKEHHLLPRARTGDKAVAEASWDLSIYLDNIRSAHNVGSILRTVEAFSMGKVYFSQTTPLPSNKQVQDTAMGCDQWITCVPHVDLNTLPRPIIVLETSDSAVSLYDYTFPDHFTLVVGNEEYGCSEITLQTADVIVEIPLRGRKNSLNVANAFAIVAGEISRQKNGSYDG
jgi:tRNA G18 (ribose-2'-O)-methylase SpoU